MEDYATSKMRIVNGKPVHYFGIYDGHGGQQIAAMAEAILHGVVYEELCEHDAVTALRNAYHKFDEIACLSAKTFRLETTGSTAVSVLISGGNIAIANIGDSEALLIRYRSDRPQYQLLTKIHHPDDSAEATRINEAGGNIYINRVEGILAVTRSFGDLYLKRENGNAAELVTADPHIMTACISPADVAIVLGSDGLWDSVTYKNVASLVINATRESDCDPMGIAHALVNLASENHSLDNITCMVVLFRHEPSHCVT